MDKARVTSQLLFLSQGAEGVQEVLQILKSEFDTAMALCGNRSLFLNYSNLSSRLRYLSFRNMSRLSPQMG